MLIQIRVQVKLSKSIRHPWLPMRDALHEIGAVFERVCVPIDTGNGDLRVAFPTAP